MRTGALLPLLDELPEEEEELLLDELDEELLFVELELELLLPEPNVFLKKLPAFVPLPR